MADAAAFRITISALDKATLTLMGIKEQFKNTFGQMKRDTETLISPIANVGNSLKNLADESGLTTVARHARMATGAVGHLIGHVFRLGVRLASLAGVASFGGLLAMAKSGAEDYEKLGVAALKTGTTMERLARLHYAAKLSGVEEPGQVDLALVRLNKSIADAASGQGKKQLAYFKAMHIELYAHKGVLKSSTQIWDQLSDAFKKNGSIAQQTRAAMALLGKTGFNLLPFLIRGSKAARDMGDEFDHLHGPIDSANYKTGVEAVEAWRKFDVAIQGLKDSIAVKLLPTITSLLEPMTEWIAKNRDWIATGIGDRMKEFGAYLKNVNWKQVGKDVLAVADAMKAVFLALRDVVLFIENHWGVVKKLGDILAWKPFDALARAGAKSPEQAEQFDYERRAREVYKHNHPNILPAALDQLLGLKPLPVPKILLPELPRFPVKVQQHGAPLGPTVLAALRSLFSVPDATRTSLAAAMPRPSAVRQNPSFAGASRPIVQVHPQPVKLNVSKGLLDVNVNINGAPPGTQVRAKPSADAPLDQVNLGVTWAVK